MRRLNTSIFKKNKKGRKCTTEADILELWKKCTLYIEFISFLIVFLFYEK